MARTRQTKPEFYEDLTLAELPIEVRYLYQGLWCHMDKSGITEGHPRLIKQRVFPHDLYDASTVQAWCKHLVSTRRLQCAVHDGKLWLRCPRFAKHQHFHRDEKPRYQIPEQLWSFEWPQETEHHASTVQAPDQHRASTPVINNLLSVINNPIAEAQSANTDTLPAPPAASAGTRRKPKPPPEPSVAVNRYFRSQYAGRYGHEPKPWGRVENSALANFVRDNGEEFAFAVVDQFFDSADPHYLKHGHPVKIMIAQAAKLWAERNNPNHARMAGAVQVRTHQVNTEAAEELDRQARLAKIEADYQAELALKEQQQQRALGDGTCKRT